MHPARSSEYGSLSRQLYATDVSTGKTVALACTPPGTGAEDGASEEAIQFSGESWPKILGKLEVGFRPIAGPDCFRGPELDTCCDPTVKHDADR